MLGINSIKDWVLPSTSDDLLPEVDDVIDFQTPGNTVYGATVKEVEYFCDTWNFFVEYTFVVGKVFLCEATQWVAWEDVL